MGVFNGRGARIDVLAISMEMRKSVRMWESAYILIIDPGANNINLTSKNNAAFVWHGLARRQPYRREVQVAQVTNPTTTQTVRFQIDFTEDGPIPDIKTNHQVWVVPTALVLSATGEAINEYPDPYITAYQHVVQGADNSSLAWIRTLETTVDTKVRPNYRVEPNGTGGFRWIP